MFLEDYQAILEQGKQRANPASSLNRTSMKEIKPINITPTEFERQVKSWLSKSGKTLKSFSVNHREKLGDRSGDYEIDVMVTLEILDGADIFILVECKRFKNPIKLDVIMLLNRKLQEFGAHKGMVFSTSGFQSGALAFATEHKIATITVQDGKTNYPTRLLGANIAPPPYAKFSKFIGWFTSIKISGGERYSLVDDHRIDPIVAWLEDKEESQQ